MAGLLFGTGGAPHSSKSLTSVAGVERIAELGLGCMELEFVRGVRMTPVGAQEIRRTASVRKVSLSAHASYFINLNAHEPEKIKASQERLLQAARAAALCGARSVIVHVAFYMGDQPEKTFDQVKPRLSEVIEQLAREKKDVCIRPELMGKNSQFGTLDEVLRICRELPGMAPCLDLSHWHARTGNNNSYYEFISMLDHVADVLGSEALKDIHIHLSGIAYGRSGEIKHLDLAESDMEYAELLRALRERRVEGCVICESPNLEADALLLQETYRKLGG